MASSQRTYGRKRKDEAAEKFDALFSDHLIKKPITIEIGKYRKAKANSGVTIASVRVKNGTSTGKSVDITPSSGTKVDAYQQKPKLDSAYVPPMKKALYDTESKNNSSSYSYSSISKSKYDILFSKNEKNASDKFDAVFGDEVKKVSYVPLNSGTKQSPEFENLFGFAAEPSSAITDKEKVSPTVIDINRIPQLSVKKHNTSADIKGASMATVGGKVVLNIQKKTLSPKKQVCISPTSDKKVDFFSFTNDASSSSKNYSSKPANQSNVKKSNKDKKDFAVAQKNQSLFSNTSSGVSSNINSKLKDCNPSLLSTQTSTTTCTNSIQINSSKLNPAKNSVQKNINSKKMFSPVKQAAGVSSKASYNSRPWMQESEDGSKSSYNKDSSISSSQPDSYDFESEESTPKLVRSVTWPERIGESIVTSLKCSKSAKAYFTVVKHVKNYQNCLEEGETKEFEDEVSYLLEGMQSTQPLSVRCLSITNFASKCQQHNFRLYLRAHNVADKVFAHLDDAKDNPALSLSTAALLFMLSRDRQMEINKSTLQLLLRLLDPFDKNDPESEKKKSKVDSGEEETGKKYKFFKSKEKKKKQDNSIAANSQSINKIKQMMASSGDHLLSEKDVSVKRLSSEALLRFTARRTVEWYREEIRIKGGLDHIISLVKSNVDNLEVLSKEKLNPDQDFKPKTALCVLERLLKVLENAIVNSPRNAMYLVTHQRAMLLKKSARLMKMCKLWLPLHSSSPPQDEAKKEVTSTSSLTDYSVLHNSIIQIIKLLVNVSNDNEWVSSRVGEQDEMLENIVDCVLTIPALLKENDRYELILLSLSLLVNLVESSAKNRIVLMKMTRKIEQNVERENKEISVVQSLVVLFEEREAAARENEVLGEVGVKKAVEAKKGNSLTQSSSSTGSQSKSAFQSGDDDGYWVETEDGMEWVPAENTADTPITSQDSCKSSAATKNPESTLTAEEKNEMKETLDKANEHMEDSIVASYAALVLGCLINGNRANSSAVRSYLKDSNGFSSMVRMLKKFLSFMSLTAGMSAKGEKTLNQIIEALEEENNRRT